MATKKEKEILEDLGRDSDNALNNMVLETRQKEIEEQRKEDASADKLEQQRNVPRNGVVEDKGPILVSGKPLKARQKPAVEPGKVYKNYPVKQIGGEDVLFLASRPFHDKTVQWDSGYEDSYEHFTETDHPMFFNSVVVKIKWLNHYKKLIDAWVIRTDEEIMLFIRRP